MYCKQSGKHTSNVGIYQCFTLFLAASKSDALTDRQRDAVYALKTFSDFARFQAPAAVEMKYSFFWVVSQLTYLFIDVMERPMGEFYVHGSVHRDSVLIRSNKMQQ